MAVRVANLKEFRAGLSDFCRGLVAGEWRSVSETIKNFRLRDFQAIRDQSDAVVRWRLIACPGVDGQIMMVTTGGKEQRAWIRNAVSQPSREIRGRTARRQLGRPHGGEYGRGQSAAAHSTAQAGLPLSQAGCRNPEVRWSWRLERCARSIASADGPRKAPRRFRQDH